MKQQILPVDEDEATDLPVMKTKQQITALMKMKQRIFQ